MSSPCVTFPLPNFALPRHQRTKAWRLSISIVAGPRVKVRDDPGVLSSHCPAASGALFVIDDLERSFLGGSEGYADFQPHYPAALFECLAILVPPNAAVWDCGAGSGRATLDLGRALRQSHRHRCQRRANRHSGAPGQC
jgi:hypothetical protein